MIAYIYIYIYIDIRVRIQVDTSYVICKKLLSKSVTNGLLELNYLRVILIKTLVFVTLFKRSDY